MIKTIPAPARLLSFLLLISATGLFLNSCKKVEVDLGTDFVDNSTTNLVLVDSATVQISTVYVDSFPTSGGGSILVGNYKDSQFGNITSKSFVQVGVPSATTIPAGSVFDSLEVILKLNKTFYGDTLSPFAVSVYRLVNPIKLPVEQSAFYNTSKSDYFPTALGGTRLTIRPTTTDTVAIPVSQALGQDFFDKLLNLDAITTNNDLFLDYFRGLAIVGDGGNNLIMGFKDSIVMRLHYRTPGVITTGVYVDFAMNNSSSQYNNISTDRTGTPIASLGPTNREIFSSQSQNAGYSQYISGAMAKISFPYLRNLLELNDFVKLIKADLIIKPVKNSFAGYYTLPPQLRLSQTDQFNVPGTDLSAFSTGATAAAIEYGNLYIDNLYGTQTGYTYDVTAYLQQQILNTTINKNGLLLLPPNLTQIFNRIVVGDKFNKESQSIVKIYYAAVK